MFRPRIIPVLLLKNDGLVKSVRFRNHRYIGDPINAVKLFNDFKADELVFLDITATKENRHISLDFVREAGEEANMPFAVGGGIKTLSDIEKVIQAGAEKVVINTAAAKNPRFIREAADHFGSSTIVVCIDVAKNWFGKMSVRIKAGSQSVEFSPVEFAQTMEQMGAGEIIVQSIDRDGTMQGYDVDLIRSISECVSVPVIALGGAGLAEHWKEAYFHGRASALAAGSMFVYQGNTQGVLINYPEREKLRSLFM
ncbi:MAG TPA: AglZ/HisF2 family acetamidino modification protein [Salinivirgaceae bacterium]|nr:AglZ/HisF2 family acetamidino modification protein [Salinivirgaceae bacterium]